MTIQFNDEDAQKAIATTKPPQFQFTTTPPERLFAREFALTGSLGKSYRTAYPNDTPNLKPAQIRQKADHHQRHEDCPHHAALLPRTTCCTARAGPLRRTAAAVPPGGSRSPSPRTRFPRPRPGRRRGAGA